MNSYIVRLSFPNDRTVYKAGYLIAPGLAVHLETASSGKQTRYWNITHTESGYSVFERLKTRKDAVAIAECFLLPLTDWRLSKDKLMQSGSIKVIAALRHVLYERKVLTTTT